MTYEELIEQFAAKYGIDDLECKDGTASLEFDGVATSFLRDEKADAIQIATEIGEPAFDDKGRFGDMLMRANYLFRSTGGGTFCRHPETGVYYLFKQLPLAQLTLDEFCQEVALALQQTEAWHTAMENYLQVLDEADEAESAAPPPSLDYFRV